MRAMRAALFLSMRSESALTVLTRSSSAHALAPSRLVSTGAAAEGSTASKPGREAISRGDRLVKEMTPVATFLGIVVTIGAIGAYYSSRLAALEERMAGTAGKLEERMAGTAGKLEERMAGTAGKLEERVAGLMETITKEVDAKNAGSEKVVDAKIVAFKEAADLRVRSRSGPGLRARLNPFAHLPSPSPAVQDQVTCSSPSPSPSSPSVSVIISVIVIVIVIMGAALAALVVLHKQRHYITNSHAGVATTCRVPRRCRRRVIHPIFQGATRTCFIGTPVMQGESL
jgi:hypothetical protein